MYKIYDKLIKDTNKKIKKDTERNKDLYNIYENATKDFFNIKKECRK